MGQPGFAEVAAAPFVAIPADQAAQYQIDFSRHFFASPEREVEARHTLEAALGELESLRNQISRSPKALLRALRIYEKALVEFIRHEDYLHLRHAVDTRDAKSADDESTLNAEFQRRTSFLRAELMAIDSARLARFEKQVPALRPYRFAVTQARRNHEHTLGVKEEELLGALGPLTSEWQNDLYDRLLDRIPFGTVPSPDGPLDVRRQQSVIANHPDRTVREAGFKQRYGALATHQDLFAFTLLRLARAKNDLARLHHFDDAASEAYFASFLTKAQVDELLAALAQQAESYKNYQRRRAEAVRSSRGYPDVHLWDVNGSLTQIEPPRYTIAEATQRVQHALAGLGPDFSREMAQLLDPRNGRLDVVSGDHRASGGFSKGFVGVDSVFFAHGFDGSYNNMRVLAHEATHAVHRQLMSRHGVSALYAEGPHYLFESFATFSELLLADALQSESREPALRQFFLEQFLQGKGTVMFVAGPEAALEEAVYDGVQKGRIQKAEDLDALTREIFARYSIWPDKEPELRSQWMVIPLMYEDPFYDLNYAYAGLLALDYYALYKQDPTGFPARYAALMEHGFDTTPPELLKKYLGIDFDGRKLVAEALRVLQGKMGEMQ
ncbi:MAG: oligoendopeptidase [Acidobacteriota bacterium]|jgi:oligoendopeptidase F|nr:oligoendopeptidase [Acidobacteriota bacterium]